jgi:hypothetical protein
MEIKVKRYESGGYRGEIKALVIETMESTIEIPCLVEEIERVVRQLTKELAVKTGDEADDEQVDPHEHCDDHPCLECTEKAYARAEAMCGGDR